MNVELEQAFDTLGVPPGTPADDVQNAYRRLIRAHHPDQVEGDTTAANQRLAEINAAKDLIDKTPRPAPVSTRRDPPTHSAESADAIRARREANARAFRKSMEARAQCDYESRDVARHAAEHVTRHSPRPVSRESATYEAEEEARRNRQAAFEAVMSGKNPHKRGSLLNRLRTLSTR